MEIQYSTLLKQARLCRTKTAWETYFFENGASIRSLPDSRLVSDIFKLLKSDAQSLQYSGTIWTTLLKSCLNTWDLQLGREITNHCMRLNNFGIAVLASKVLLESGERQTAREFAQKALRRSGATDTEQIQLEMVVCSSYVEEGKRTPALKILRRIEPIISIVEVSNESRAEFYTYVARTLFLLGKYAHAAKPFAQASDIYLELKDWENAARCLFNAAASLDNAGASKSQQEAAFSLIERCRAIAAKHDLRGTLAHCDAFYGHNDYWKGNFPRALEHYKTALGNLPENDRGYRRLHIVSMIAFTYLRTGKYKLAQKFGDEILQQSSNEKTGRFESRYQNLTSELLWERGDVETSMQLLYEAAEHYISNGVNILEELSTLSRYYLQLGLLGRKSPLPEHQINDQLRKNVAGWCEYLFAMGHYHLGLGEIESAEKWFLDCIERAEHQSDYYHTGMGLLGLIQTRLARRSPVQEIEGLYSKLRICTGHMIESPLKSQAHLVAAAIQYRTGNFEECLRSLALAQKSAPLGITEDILITTWRETAGGHAVKLSDTWKRELVSRFTKIYFAPHLIETSPSLFKISDHYVVDLSRHPAIADLIRFLANRADFSASPEEIQTHVWKQSLHHDGWQQKIRNTIMRTRQMFGVTMAPFILHDERIELNAASVRISSRRAGRIESPESIVLDILKSGPLSSHQLANRLNLSSATIKRTLKRLSDSDKINLVKVGRSIVYTASNSERSTILHN